MALIPDYPDQEEVEVSKEAWPLIRVTVRSVRIALESGTFRVAFRPFPRTTP